MQALRVVGLVVALAGCSAAEPAEIVQSVGAAKVIDANDLTPVLQDGANIPGRYAGLIDAFGIVSMNGAGCTATHIGNGLVLTAGHCFDAPATRRDDFSCAGAKVRWGIRQDSPAYLTSNCTIVRAAQQNFDIDYAIFQVDVAPPVAVEVDLAPPALETPITIFSHPKLRPLEWSQVCVMKDRSNGHYGAHEFAHQCDTDSGSSGATVLDDATLRVIGIHGGGISPWNYATYLADTPLAEILAAR